MADTLPFNESGGRRLEGISHFFLTDPDPEGIPSSHPTHSESNGKNIDKTASIHTHAPVYAIVSPEGVTQEGTLLGCLLARAMATADISVGLVETTTRLPYTFFLSGGYKNINAVYWETDPRLPDFLDLVARMRSGCELVLLNMVSTVLPGINGLGTLVRRYLVPTVVHPDALLNAYATIKKIVTHGKDESIDFIVFNNQLADNVAGAAVILEEMTRRFLSCTTRLAGAIPLAANNATVVGDCLSTAFLQRMPENATAAAREIACNLMQSDGLR